jgi:hypothetical protein
VTYDGQISWSHDCYSLAAACAIGDADGDSKPEIFLGTEDDCDEAYPGQITCLDVSTGESIWSFSLDEEPAMKNCYGLALGDLDCDGDLELVATTAGLDNYPFPPWGKLLVFNAQDEDPVVPIFARDIYGRGMVAPAIGNITDVEGLEIVSGGDVGDVNPGEGVMYCWDHVGNLQWSVGPNNDARFWETQASPVLASFSAGQAPILHVLVNVADADHFARLWLIRASDAYLYNDHYPPHIDPPPYDYPQDIHGEAWSGPALLGGWDYYDMSITVGSFDSGHPWAPERRVYAYDSDVLNDSAHIEWGMYYHDPKHTGRHDQPVAGGISTSVAWYGNYTLWGDVNVSQGGSLRIEPGTVIKVKDGFEIGVSPGGTLIIEGEENNPVVITSDSPTPVPGIWPGIWLNDGVSATIRYCNISYANNAVYAKPNSNAIIEHSTFENCLSSGFYGNQVGSANINHCTFTNCGNYGAMYYGGGAFFDFKYGFKYLGDGLINVRNNIMTGTGGTSYWGIYFGPRLLGDTPTPMLTGDSVTYFGQGGIYVENSSGGSLDKLIRSKHNSIYGLYLKNSSLPVTALDNASHNTFSYSSYGIYCGLNCNSIFRWNKIVKDNYGVYVSSTARPDFGTDLSWGNNKIEKDLSGTYEMKNDNPSYTVPARHNWWGTDGAQTQGLVDASNPLPGDYMPGYERREAPQAPAPSELALNNYPNPFNLQTEIRFSLPHAGYTEISIYDITGRQVSQPVSGDLQAGEHTIIWDGIDDAGRPISSGVYLYSITTSTGRLNRKMVLLK